MKQRILKKMKDSGIQWIGQIPEEWKVIKFKYLFNIVGGNGFPDSLQGNETGDYPFCKVSDINGGSDYVEKAQNYVTKKIVSDHNFNVIPVNSIIMSKIGIALMKNHRKINTVECCIDNNTQALIPHRCDNLKYLFYLSKLLDMKWFDNNGTIPSINNSKLLNFFVPDVDITVQTRIACFLDQKCLAIDSVLEKTKASIEEYKKLKLSVITEAVTGKLNIDTEWQDLGYRAQGAERKGNVLANENLSHNRHCEPSTDGVAIQNELENTLTLNKVFSSSVTTPSCLWQATSPQGEALEQPKSFQDGKNKRNYNCPKKDSSIAWIGKIPDNWEVAKIKNICKLQTGNTPSTSNPEWFDGDLNWFTPSDFTSFSLNNSYRKLSIKAKEEGVAVIIPANSVFIIGIGGTAGKIACCNFECSCNQQITALINPIIKYKFLMYALVANSKYIKETAFYTTLPILNNQTIGNFKIAYPKNLLEQQAIADYLDAKCSEIDNLIAKKEQFLKEIETYKKSLIYEYVTGKKEVEN